MPIDFHLLVPRRARIVPPPVEQRGLLAYFDVDIKIKVSQRWYPGAVRSLVLTHQHERLVPRAVLFEPLECHVGHDICAVTLDLRATSRTLEKRVVVVFLSRRDRSSDRSPVDRKTDATF